MRSDDFGGSHTLGVHVRDPGIDLTGRMLRTRAAPKAGSTRNRQATS